MFSFIVPVYNCKSYIGGTVDSIERQGLTDYEIILVDDGSTDGSGILCDKLAAENRHINVVHKQNGGASSARNAGIKSARGEYIIFIDGDDTIDPLLIHDFECCFKSEFGLLIFGMKFMYYHSDHIDTQIYSNQDNEQISLGELADRIITFFSNNSLSSACNKVFNAALIKDNNLEFNEELKVYEDLDFVLKYLACLDSQRIHVFSRSGYNYRILVDSLGDKGSRFSDFALLMVIVDSITRSLAVIGNKTGSQNKCNYLAMVILNYFILEYLKRSKRLSDDIELVQSHFQRSSNQQIFNKLSMEEQKQLIFLECIAHKKKNILILRFTVIHIKRILRNFRDMIKTI